MPNAGKKVTGQGKDVKKAFVGRPPAMDEVRARHLYDRGASDPEIAAETGVERSTVAKWRRKHGLPSNRKHGKRGPGKGIRVDHQDAIEKVVPALIETPLAGYRELALMAWPGKTSGELEGDGIASIWRLLIGEVPECEKRVRAAVERVRQALKDLARNPGLAGNREEAVTAILAERAHLRAEKQHVRLEQAAAKAARRVDVERMREERWRRGSARQMLRRVMYYSEAGAALRTAVATALADDQAAAREEIGDADLDGQEEIDGLRREMRIQHGMSRQTVRKTKLRMATGKADGDLSQTQIALHALPRSKDQITDPMPVPHFAPGPGGTVMHGSEAQWRSELEINIQNRAVNLATFPADAGLELVKAAKRVRKARRKMWAGIEAEAMRKYDAAEMPGVLRRMVYQLIFWILAWRTVGCAVPMSALGIVWGEDHSYYELRRRMAVLNVCQTADPLDPELRRLKEDASRAAADLNDAARRAVRAVGWAVPSGSADQSLESPDARKARLEITMRNVEDWAREPQDLSRKFEDWPAPWTGPPAEAPPASLYPRMQDDDGVQDGVDPEVADVFSGCTVRLAGGRRRSYCGDGGRRSAEERSVAQEGLRMVRG